MGRFDYCIISRNVTVFFCFRIDLCLDHVTCPKNIPNMKVLFIMLILRRKFVKFQPIRTQSDVRGKRFTVCTEIANILGTVRFTIRGGSLRYKRYDAHFLQKKVVLNFRFLLLVII
jgi:hypothetical protein